MFCSFFANPVFEPPEDNFGCLSPHAKILFAQHEFTHWPHKPTVLTAHLLSLRMLVCVDSVHAHLRVDKLPWRIHGVETASKVRKRVFFKSHFSYEIKFLFLCPYACAESDGRCRKKKKFAFHGIRCSLAKCIRRSKSPSFSPLKHPTLAQCAHVVW